ncbi:hypothetical protein IW140_002343 [Coemansia sp. RSA 1813]|nr:hypothetical protein EV178_002006 [Coemansia sp. RSA 1646]KAJ1771816.1 hypothetical protein LPJ74_001990 [Coemansia sp. RSA 1843]KAJ2090781.1 hypothetical protein IW138_002399 [Coemansia sp. RSA 986]KAJ2216029.1 hypothetical protein EV179_001680 [Coemansia sp. RSA 487]KAJ2570443.1 hypothetical protein IW140_002343 [Coemansia sp. RSA 1813]
MTVINNSIKDTNVRAVPEISSQGAEYQLTPMDGNPSSRANLQFVFFYTLPSTLDKKKVGIELRKAFYQTMVQYPILYGRIEVHAEPVVKVTREYAAAKGMPRYEEHEIGGTVSAIRAAHYNWSVWPHQLLSIRVARGGGTADSESHAPLVQCIVTWFDDGLGILFSVDHSIADGIGIDILLNKWAQTARSSSATSGEIKIEGDDHPSLVPVDFDHQSFYRDICTEDPHADWFVRHVDGLTTGAPVQGIISGEGSPSEIEHALQANVHSLRITPESLTRLYNDMNGTGDRVPVIRLAYALVWQRYMAAKRATSACFLNIIHSGRHLVGRPHYIGNAVCPTYMQLPAADLTTMSTWDVAQTVGLHMHATAKSQWLAFCLHMKDPVWFAKFLTIFASPQASQLTVSNISRLHFYKADFGFGGPDHATLYPTLIPGFTTWMPMGPSGGLHILWNIPSTVLQILTKDDVFCKYVDVVF